MLAWIKFNFTTSFHSQNHSNIEKVLNLNLPSKPWFLLVQQTFLLAIASRQALLRYRDQQLRNLVWKHLVLRRIVNYTNATIKPNSARFHHLTKCVPRVPGLKNYYMYRYWNKLYGGRIQEFLLLVISKALYTLLYTPGPCYRGVKETPLLCMTNELGLVYIWVLWST